MKGQSHETKIVASIGLAVLVVAAIYIAFSQTFDNMVTEFLSSVVIPDT